MKTYCVYLIKNIVNDKVYIGKTSSNTNKRWADHVRTALSEESDTNKKQYIHKAIAKYGLDKFEFSIIKYYSTEVAAYKGEIRYIKKYNSYGNGGYNLTPGGLVPGTTTRILSKAQVKQIFRDYIFTDMSCKEIAIKYNINSSSIKSILSRESYLDVKISDEIRYKTWLKTHRNFYNDHKFGKNSSFTKLQKQDIKNVFKDYASGQFNLTDLSFKYNTAIGNISFILERITWSQIKIDKRTLNKAQINLSKLKNSTNRVAKEDKETIKNNVFKDYKNNQSKQEIARKYNITVERVVKILNNSCWKNVTLFPEFSYLNKITQLNNQIAQAIINDYITNMSITELSKKYNVKISKIKNILYRKTFTKMILDKNIEDQLNNKLHKTKKRGL